jgi:hypothetical protein
MTAANIEDTPDLITIQLLRELSGCSLESLAPADIRQSSNLPPTPNFATASHKVFASDIISDYRSAWKNGSAQAPRWALRWFGRNGFQSRFVLPRPGNRDRLLARIAQGSRRAQPRRRPGSGGTPDAGGTARASCDWTHRIGRRPTKKWRPFSPCGNWGRRIREVSRIVAVRPLPNSSRFGKVDIVINPVGTGLSS